MDLSDLLTQIGALPVRDRRRLIEAIWDTIPDDRAEPGLTEDQKRTLQQRLADLEANPTNVLTWAQIKAHVRRGR